MSIMNDKGAFPIIQPGTISTPSISQGYVSEIGATVGDLAAIKVLQVMAHKDIPPEEAAKKAYEYATAFIKERNLAH